MANPIEYIVFEPDQVLTNDHLNETFDYLDQQNRWTRNRLIGIGIVCGLDVALYPGVIEITKGCGVTSQGYLITQDTNQYNWYTPYAAIDPPLDPPFDYPYGNLPFYKPFCTAAKNPVYLLLTDTQHTALGTADAAAALSIGAATQGFLDDYAVVLFLEANEMDLKNCDTQDCNNKGRKMTFQVRPLLVAKADLPVVGKGNTTKPSPDLNLPHQIKFTRYNVPYTDLNNTDDVINAFKNIVTDALLTEVTNSYRYCYAKYGAILKMSAPPFDTLFTTLQGYRDQILSKNPIFIEYFYDFIDDLIKAWYEFSVKVSGIISTCCPDENLFPLHLVLGGASQATSSYASDSYRTYFIYSPLFSKMGSESSEVVFLFNRMVIMTQQFAIQVQQTNQFQTFENITALRILPPIKITPSQYEYPWLSERAIPYYYNINVSGSELYKSWNYYRTMHGSAAFNLGYNAYQYNTNSAVTEPLLYDIEHYNFFRVEGHIGFNYQTVLSNILDQRQKYNLPFDVVAISADLLTSNAVLPDCNFQDLETGYKLLLSEAMCKIHTTYCYISKLPYTALADTGLQLGGVAVGKESTAGGTTTSIASFSKFKLSAENTLNMNEFFVSDYAKGDFMRKFCPPVDGTFGSIYLAAISKNALVGLLQANPTNNTSGVYRIFFEYLDAVEELMMALQTNTLAAIDMASLQQKYITYLRILVLVIEYLSFVDAQNANGQTGAADNGFATLLQTLELDLLLDELDFLLTLCLDERLQVLKDEYTRRLTLYQQQHTFLNYYQKHPGLEHKAGVPKGGTLVLVYHNNTARLGTVGLLPVESESTGTKLTLSSYLNATDIDMIRSFVDDCQDAPADKKQKLIAILAKRPPVRQPVYNIPNNAVIADFYIPYMCCSDCPPVAYIMPPVQTPPVTPPTGDQPVIQVGSLFCVNDTNPEPITVPDGGTLTMTPPTPALDSIKHTFTPALGGPGTFTINYTSAAGVVYQSATIVVVNVPDSGFIGVSTFIMSPAGKPIGLNVTFTPKDTGSIYTYQWEFGPSFSLTTSTEAIPTLTASLVDNQIINTSVKLLVSASGLSCGQKPTENQYTISGNGLQLVTQPAIKPDETFLEGIENIFKKKKK